MLKGSCCPLCLPGVLGLMLQPSIAKVTPDSDREPAGICSVLQMWCPDVDLCRLQDTGRSPSEIGHSWREWQGSKQH